MTLLGLTALILMFGPVSGAHFNPVVSAADWWLGRRLGTGLSGRDVAAYSAAQLVGGGVALALVRYLYPQVGEVANDVIVPHDRPADPPRRVR